MYTIKPFKKVIVQCSYVKTIDCVTESVCVCSNEWYPGKFCAGSSVKNIV